MKLPGSATAAGTQRYRQRFDGEIPPEHFHQVQGLWMSSIGMGTYLGNHDDATDQQYREAIVRAVESGCNVIDSAINYRCQRSERSIGAALKELTAKGYGRDEVIIATKGGFLPFDGTPPSDPRSYFTKTFIDAGVAAAPEIVGGYHCMTPRYLLNQLDCSLRNLDLECVDIYYVHNPESQLGKITREEFDERLVKAFEALEQMVASGKIRMYGTATWNAYRNPAEAKDYLALAQVVGLARKSRRQKSPFQSNSVAAQSRHERGPLERQSTSRRKSHDSARSGSGAGRRRHVQRFGAARTIDPQPAGVDSRYFRWLADGRTACAPVCPLDTGRGHGVGRHEASRARK